MDCYKNANTNHTPQTIYTAVFLADYCKRTLTDWWAKHVRIPLLSNVHASHMTIHFRPSEDEIDMMRRLMGEEVVLTVIGWAADDACQTLLVRVDPKLVTQDLTVAATAFPSADRPFAETAHNEHLHITIATDGCSPVHSNKLLEAFHRNMGPGRFDTAGHGPIRGATTQVSMHEWEAAGSDPYTRPEFPRMYLGGKVGSLMSHSFAAFTDNPTVELMKAARRSC